MTINFFALPYLVQKRFIELIDRETGLIFFKVNENTAAFSNLRKIVQFADIYFTESNPNPRIHPKIENLKIVEVSKELHIRGSIKFMIKDNHFSKFIPAYLTKIVFEVEYIQFRLLKTFIKHKFLKCLHFHGHINVPIDETEDEIKEFFDLLVNLSEVKFKLRDDFGENKLFHSVAKKSLKGHNYSFDTYGNRLFIFTGLEFTK